MAFLLPPTELVALVARARRFGPLPYSAVTPPVRSAAVVEVVGWLPGQVDRWWEGLGRPDPFVVVEAGAGRGERAQAVVGAGLACAAALRYVLVEASAAGREAQVGRVPLEEPAMVLGPLGPGDDEDDDRPVSLPGIGPLATALVELPAVAVTGVVLTVGQLSQLPYDLFEWRGADWSEVRLAPTAAGGLVELLVAVSPEVHRDLTRLWRPEEPGAAAGRVPAEGTRLMVQVGAREWLVRALRVLERGRVVVVDQLSTTAAMAGAGGGAGADVGLAAMPVAVDQLASVRRPARQGPIGSASSLAAVEWDLGS